MIFKGGLVGTLPDIFYTENTKDSTENRRVLMTGNVIPALKKKMSGSVQGYH